METLHSEDISDEDSSVNVRPVYELKDNNKK